ncbi:MAG: FkbM family methyltransferase [Mariprofundaceae bacterium]
MILRKLVAKLSGNLPVQRILEYVVFACQYFQGIGAGSSVGDSGEEAVFRRLLNVNAEPCVIDAGANKGQFLQLALRSCEGDGLTIHCFEPSKAAFTALSTVASGKVRVIVNHCALGKAKGRGRLYYDEEASGLASMSRRNLDHIGVEFSQSEAINVLTLEEYCLENEIEQIDLLKMDVEGHELDILAGAEPLFVNDMIKMVLFEFGGANIDTRTFFHDFFAFFKRFDMDIFRITPSGFLVPITSYKEQYEQFRTTNFICIKRNLV